MKKLTLCISVLFMLIGLSSMNADAPVAATSFAGGDGTSNDPFQISTFEELYYFSNYASGKQEYFALTANINAAASKDVVGGYPSIALFVGQLNGNGFEIDSLVMSEISFITKIKKPAANASYIDPLIKDLGFTNINVKALNNSNVNQKNLGGICGFMDLLARIERCYVTGSVYGRQSVGGITGNIKASAKIANCYVSGTVLRKNAATTLHTSGIAGVSSGGNTIENCFFNGTSRNAINSLNGKTSVTYTNCYYVDTCTLDAALTDQHATSLTVADMAIATNYTDWDFDNIWEMKDGMPALRKPMYAVAFDCNSAYGSITGATSGSYAAGTEFTVTAAPKNGETFEGWYANGEKIDGASEALTYTNGMSDVTLYAHFTTTSSIQDLYYYNGFNTAAELVVTAKNTYSSNWSGYQGGNTDGGTFETIGDQTYNKIHWNTDVLYYGGTDRNDVQMEMAFQAISADPGLDFLLRAANTGNGGNDRKTAINVQIVTKYTTEDSIIVKLNDNGNPILITVPTGTNITNDGTEYKFMVRLVANQLSAWLAEVSSDYSATPQLDYTITGDEGFQATGVYGFGVTDGQSALINYFAAGAPSPSIPTKMEDVIENPINIYPNPAKDFFTVATTDAVSVSVIDLSGKTVIASQMVSGTQNISISSLSSGLYFVKVGAELTKLIVE